MPPQKPSVVVWEPGRAHDVVYVKLEEGAEGTPGFPGARVRPLFDVDAPVLSGWYRVETAPWEGPEVAEAFNAEPWVELAYLPGTPVPPPVDLAPATPDFQADQAYLDDAPIGLGIGEAALWPGSDGVHVAVADLEYSWDSDHEDLDNTIGIRTSGWDSGLFRFHGTAVMSELVSPDNGYGVTGIVPGAEPVVVFPYTEPEVYDIAASIVAAVGMLEPGDVLLIEQQAYMNGAYAPVEAEPASWDAIAYAVESGIVVVEPAGNGGQDLDAAYWGGWFDRSERDSGAILVGGGNSPDSGSLVRSAAPGSCYGSRVDLQGWYDGIVTAINGDYNGYYADLFYPDEDGRQAYTTRFGGTSGASPMVAGVAAIFQSVAIELHGEPWDPMDLRQLMVSTGTPAQGSRTMGPQPDLRRMLRYGMIPG